MKKTETFVGDCSKYITCMGWTTKIPVEELNKRGYYKVEDSDNIVLNTKREIAQMFLMAQYIDGEKGLENAIKTFILEYGGNKK